MRIVLIALLWLCAAAPAAADERFDAFRLLIGTAPVWDAERLETLADALATLADDGLNPEAYGLAGIRQLARYQRSDAPPLSCTRAFATEAWVNALHDLARGRLSTAGNEDIWRAHPTSLSGMTAALARTGADDIAATFDAVRPQHAEYRALRQAHVELMQRTDAEPPTIPDGPSLHVGERDARVILLRERLAWLGYPTTDGTDTPARFDTALLETVKNFQRAHSLHPDGVVGANTLAVLNPGTAERIARVRANLERWRQVSRDLLPTQLRVNIGDARVALLRDGKTVWSARVQVGREARPTPLLQSTITRLTINPAWVVPPTILRKDKLPAIRDDIGVLQRDHLHVINASTGQEIDPHTIDWNAPGGILLRQEPGPHGALGRVAFRFNNPFAVFLHDTPSQGLFNRDQRTLSSGCVRVERALELAEILLTSPDANERLDDWLKTNKTREVRLDEPVSVLISYFGAAVDGNGRLTLRPDIYGHDAKLAAALARDMRPAPLPTCLTRISSAPAGENLAAAQP